MSSQLDPDALCARVRELERAHGNLLAVIHRDGGHHVDRVGWKQAAKDAERVVIALRERVRELEASR